MKTTSTRHGDVLVLAVQGSLDVITSPDLEKQLLGLIDGGERRLVLDLAPLDYVSSAGLRTFLLVMKRMKEVGGHLRFAALQKQVKQVFDIAGLSFRVALFPNVAAALEGFPAAPPKA